MLRNLEKVKKGNIKYKLRTNIGREFIVGEDEDVECVDIDTFHIKKYKPSEVFGKYIIVKKPMPVVDEIKYINRTKLNFKLGHLIGLFIIRTSINHSYDNKYILYFRDSGLRNYFIETMAGKFDDFNFKIANHNTFESSASDLETSSIEFSSNKFASLIKRLGLKPRDNVCPACIDNLSMKFRKGMMLGMLDSSGFFEYKDRGEAPDKLRHIRVIIRDTNNEYISSLFKFSDYIDVDFFFEKYDKRSRLTLSSSELIRHRKYFKRCKSVRFKKFLHNIKGERIRRLTGFMPVSRKVNRTLKMGSVCRDRPAMAKDSASKHLLRYPDAGLDDEDVVRWRNLAADDSIRFEKFRKPIKVVI